MKRKRKRMHSPARAFEPTADRNDPISRLTEWQEHRYDPGYYIGGDFHPLVTASRRNKYGYFLIMGAIMILVLLPLGLRAGAIDWYALSVTASVMLFMFVVGFKLIKKPPSQQGTARGRRRASSRDN